MRFGKATKMKISKSKFKRLLNECVHQYTKGKSTEDIVAAIKTLEGVIKYLQTFLARRGFSEVPVKGHCS